MKFKNLRRPSRSAKVGIIVSSPVCSKEQDDSTSGTLASDDLNAYQ